MLIATPLLQGETLHPDVIRGVARIGSPWVIVSAPAMFPGYPRECSINHTRAQLHAEVVKRLMGVSHVLLLDSDVVLPQDDFINPMRDMLDHGCVAACLRTKPSDHVLAACALVRADVYAAHMSPVDRMSICQCRRLAGLGPIAYVDGFTAIEIVRD